MNKSKFTQVGNLVNFSDFYYEIDNVLTNEECDYIINVAKDKLSKSTVMSIDKTVNILM